MLFAHTYIYPGFTMSLSRAANGPKRAHRLKSTIEKFNKLHKPTTFLTQTTKYTFVKG